MEKLNPVEATGVVAAGFCCCIAAEATGVDEDVIEGGAADAGADVAGFAKEGPLSEVVDAGAAVLSLGALNENTDAGAFAVGPEEAAGLPKLKLG